MNAYEPYRQILPPVVKNLLIINGLMFLLLMLGERWGIEITQYLGLFPFESPFFRPWQLITHVFMHGDLMHIFSNMFALWMFGSVVENYWGPKKFLIYYMITALGAVLLHEGVIWWNLGQIDHNLQLALQNNDLFQVEILKEKYLNILRTPTVGASGAVFGVLLAYGMMFPNTLVYLYFAIPIKAKYFVVLYGLLELYLGVKNNPADNVAHFAHLGGMLFGFLLIQYWKKRRFNQY